MRVNFGQFVVDTQAERLWKNGIEVKLREQPLQVLLALLRDAGEVVSRESLRKQLWGGSTYVDFDNGLNTAISRLREVLEDDPKNPVWIERVPKRGYRFIGALPRSAAVAAYLKGHHVISPHSPENMQKSLAFFREALALDPSYPLAYHGAALVSIFRKVKRVLKPDGTLWLVIGDCYLKKDRLLIPARVALALQADGWIIRDEVIWHKPRTTPTPVKDRTCAAHEMVYCFSLGPKYYYDYLGIEEPSKNAGRVVKYNGKQKNTGLVEKAPGSVARNITIRATRRKRSVWSVSPQASKSMHTATFPIDLITPMIVAGCPIGGTVLDPFGGMGTTGLVAQSLKRKAILIELNPSYAKLSLERIQADRK